MDMKTVYMSSGRFGPKPEPEGSKFPRSCPRLSKF
jgi:hypothetical protein